MPKTTCRQVDRQQCTPQCTPTYYCEVCEAEAAASDSYGSPAAPVQDSYGSPAAPVQDSYGSPAAAPVQESYGSPRAVPAGPAIPPAYQG